MLEQGCGKETPVIGVSVHQAPALTADRAETFTASPFS